VCCDRFWALNGDFVIYDVVQEVDEDAWTQRFVELLYYIQVTI